jgi:hypothetical protein
MKLILTDLTQDEWLLGVRAGRWLAERVQKDAIVSYGDGDKALDLYVKRNKASISVRPCDRRS